LTTPAAFLSLTWFSFIGATLFSKFPIRPHYKIKTLSLLRLPFCT
jgi:hypothetical protein